jgi:hypothetical protein
MIVSVSWVWAGKPDDFTQSFGGVDLWVKSDGKVLRALRASLASFLRLGAANRVLAVCRMLSRVT